MSFFVSCFWKIWNFWFTLPDKIRFVLVGGFNATVQYILFVLFLWILGEEKYQFSLVLSWVISSFSSFATQKIFVFCTKGNLAKWVEEYIKCVGVWITSYFINAIILDLLVRLTNTTPYIAQIIAIACTTVSGYILFKYFAFRKSKKKPS